MLMIQYPVAAPRGARRPELVVLAAKARAASATTTSLQVKLSNAGSRVCRPTLLEPGHAVIRARLSVCPEYLEQHGPIALPELTVELAVDLAAGDVLTLCSLNTLPHPVAAVLAMGGSWLVVADRVDGRSAARSGEDAPVRAALSKNRFVFANA